MAKTNNPVLTRFTTGKVRLTYAFLWSPRASDNEDGDAKDEKSEKYSSCILIPKGDQATIDKLNLALSHAVQAGQAKGLWGANLPSSFKWPLRDGDAEYLEKGEEYKGHWFLNATSVRKPRIVDLARNDIYDESEVYSGCYARVCINLYPFSKKGSRGIACGLEAVQKICDGEMLGGAPVDVDEAFGDSEAYLSDAGYAQPVNGYVQPTPGPVQAQPVPQPPVGYAPGQMQGYPQQMAAAPVQQPPIQQAPVQQTPAGYPGPQYPAQQGVQYQQPTQPPVQGVPNTFANNVAAADSVLPPQLFGEGKRVA